MQGEADYAEMLEIPISTVNVVQKKNKKKSDLREKVIRRVNERVRENPDPVFESDGRQTESVAAEDVLPKEEPLHRKIFIAEFAAACLLCVSIFLTNVFMENSALNTFTRSLFAPTATRTDKRTYNDFTLSSIVSERSDLSVEASPTGVLSFTGEAVVYPVCDGRVDSLTKSDEGYTLVVAHSDNFRSIVAGLSAVYCAVGESVKGNLPVGYSDGKKTVQVMLYENDTLLSGITVDGRNGLSWKQ